MKRPRGDANEGSETEVKLSESCAEANVMVLLNLIDVGS